MTARPLAFARHHHDAMVQREALAGERGSGSTRKAISISLLVVLSVRTDGQKMLLANPASPAAKRIRG